MRLRVQRAIGWVFFAPVSSAVVAIMKWGLGFRVENHEQLRRQFRELIRDRTPLLICCNHFTYIDSCIILWALGWHFWYLFRFRCFSWNLPAAEYKKNPAFLLIGYLAKCIFIRREGGARHLHGILRSVSQLLREGEVVTIFPEGRRSRTGTFESSRLALGTGKILSEVPGCRVLCLYLRGDRQVTFSKFPARGSQFYLDTRLIVPKSEQFGKAAHREIVAQIGSTIASMEEKYFAQARSHQPDCELS